MEASTVPVSKISAGIEIPKRSRTFTPSEVQTVLSALQQGQNVGYGVFKSAPAARSAGVTLNTMLVAAGAEHKYATTVFRLDDDAEGNERWQGAIKPQQAKAAPAPKGQGRKGRK